MKELGIRRLTPDNEEQQGSSEVEPKDDAGEPSSRIYEIGAHELTHWLRGDWEPPDALVLAFTDEWADSLAYLIAGAIDQAKVTLLVDPTKTTKSRIAEWLKEFNLPAEEIRVQWVRLNSPWVRDYGPLQLVPAAGAYGDPIWLDPEYSSRRPDDDAVPVELARDVGVEMAALPVPLQGGAIISNGRGLCALTIEYCLEKDIDFEDPAIMDSLLKQIGCQTLALIPDLKDDSTRHADMFAQFLAPDRVAVALVNRSENAEDAARMDDAALALQRAAERMGTRLKVTRVPIPYLGVGRYLTYVNGLRLRESFLVPSYRDAPPEVEESAYHQLSESLPGVGLVTVPADKIIPLSGSLHCITLGLTLPKRAEHPFLNQAQ